MDFKLELIPVPVSDVDRAKAFYEQAGFAVDNDVTVKEGLRFVQLTPPGSASSVSIGEGITEMERPLAVALRDKQQRSGVLKTVPASESWPLRMGGARLERATSCL